MIASTNIDTNASQFITPRQKYGTAQETRQRIRLQAANHQLQAVPSRNLKIDYHLLCAECPRCTGFLWLLDLWMKVSPQPYLEGWMVPV